MNRNFYTISTVTPLLLSSLGGSVALGNATLTQAAHEPAIASTMKKNHPKKEFSADLGYEEEGIIDIRQLNAVEVPQNTAILFGSLNLKGIKSYQTETFEKGEATFRLFIGSLEQENPMVTYKVEGYDNDPKILYKTEDLVIGNLYPNPVGSAASIAYQINNKKKQVELIVTNVLGSEVKRYSLPTQGQYLKIEVEDLKRGFYFYTLAIDGENKVTKKFLVEH